MSRCPAEPDPAVNDRRRFIIAPFVYQSAVIGEKSGLEPRPYLHTMLCLRAE